MTMRKTVTHGYQKHVEAVQGYWEQALHAEGFDAALIHAGDKLPGFLDDYEYPFRCNPHLLWWAPLMTQHDSALWVRPGRKPKLFYYQPDDYWHTPPSDPESWWAEYFDIETVRDENAWKQAIAPNTAYVGDAPSLASAVASKDLNPGRLVNAIHICRTRKTDYEIACMAEAAHLGAVAHQAAEQAFLEGLSEYDIHQRYCMAIKMVDAELPYGNIVALNEHGSVLHYQQHEKQAPRSSRSFLIDAGATCHQYASDITRTYAAQPCEFADLIQAMENMQQGVCASVVDGLDYRQLHLQAHREIAVILKDFGIINGSVESALETGLSGVFYPHGLGHYIGLQTHDVAGLIADADGTPIPPPPGHPFLRLTRHLQAGNVVTIEPGLYFIEPLLRAWRENGDVSAINWDRIDHFSPYGGIRIEDDVVVTESTPRNLTRQAFADL